ncbi:MAG: hypothetical protein IPG22_11625 [Acidobacteria bacterium]|nr:hypothetical protein [Acidobacteriota bacterium]
MKYPRKDVRSFGFALKHSRPVIFGLVLSLLVIFALFQNGGRVVEADSSIGNVAVCSNPRAITVNPVTNKIYVACTGGGVAVIDGSNNSTSGGGSGDRPYAVAVNPVTSKVYVANLGGNNVTVTDTNDNSTATVTTGTNPYEISINSITNKIYVANSGSNNVTVIDGITNSTTNVSVGDLPVAVAVNPVTNKIYVANSGSGNLTVIDGATNSTTTVAAGTGPRDIVVNPVTNKIYVAVEFGSSVRVIDGTNNSTISVPVGTNPYAVAVNPVTNKIYVANQGSNTVTVIDGMNNSTSTVPTVPNPGAVAINSVTNKIYVVGGGVTVIDGANNSTTNLGAGGIQPFAVAVNPVTNKVYVTNLQSSNVTVIDGSYNTTVTVAAGTTPIAIATNPVTNRTYVANRDSNNVTVIDGTNNTTATVPVGINPHALAINPTTNKIYVANRNSNSVTVIDGGSNSTVSVPVGSNPLQFSIAVNAVTNKIYVANYGDNNITIIEGSNNSTTSVAVGIGPYGIDVNPVTNKIYVANSGSSTVTVIDGNNNTAATVPVGERPNFVAVNAVTNRAYVANFNSNDVTVIDGANNNTITVPTVLQPISLAINSITNRVYVGPIGGSLMTIIDGFTNISTTLPVASRGLAVNTANNKIYAINNNPLTVIDGTNNSTTTVAVGSGSEAIAVNPITNKVYVANIGTSNVSIITPAPSNSIPLNTVAEPFPSNTTPSATPTFTLTATSTYSPTVPPPRNIYFQMDTTNGTWTRATNSGSTATTVTANAIPATLQRGLHTIYFFATDGSDATSINPITGEQLVETESVELGTSSPESSPVIGGINAYSFLANIPCTFGVTPNSQNFGSSAGASSATVETNGCSWNAVSNNPWITVTGGNSRSGNGLFSFSVAANNGPARTGTITIGGQTVTINQANACTYSISPSNSNISANGGNGTTNVTSVTGCTWAAASNDAWITITGGSSGSGNGTVSYSVQPTNGPARTGTFTVGGQTFTVSQASGCTYSLAPTSTSIGSGAVGSSFALTTSNSGCTWTSVSNNPWITISGGTSGTGNGTVFFNVQANTGPARTGTITTGGQTFTIDQANGCTFALSAPSANIAAGGGNSSFTVTTVAGCSRTAVSNDAWITVTGGGSGTGTGTVSFSVQPNIGPARTGTITAAGQTFTINQGSGCTFSISPTSANASATGGNGSFALTTVAGCNWTAVSTVPWITITSGSSGSGNGDISFSVEANTLNARSGTITAGGRTFAVNQATGCTFSLSLQSVSIAAFASTGGFSINGIPACSWTAVSNDPWITITGNNSGNGSGNISFTATANSGPPRVGTITAGGQTFTVNQANGCAFAFSPNGTSFSASGGVGGFNVTTNSACIWTAISNANWINVTSGSGTGNGSVTFSVLGNNGAARTGEISIASQIFTVNQLAPNNLVSITGRVLTPTGLGVRNALVILTDSQGTRQTATTSSFGVYTFTSVRSGESYFLGVSSKRYRFAPRSITPTANMTDIDLIGLE